MIGGPMRTAYRSPAGDGNRTQSRVMA